MNAKIHLFINQEYLQQDNSRHMSVGANFLVVYGVNGTMFLTVTYHNPSNLSVYLMWLLSIRKCTQSPLALAQNVLTCQFMMSLTKNSRHHRRNWFFTSLLWTFQHEFV